MADNDGSKNEIEKYVSGTLTGEKDGLNYVITGELLTDDQKIDRDLVFQAGRAVEKIAKIELVVGPKADEKARRIFTATIVDGSDNGKWLIKETGQPDVLADRSTSKRPKTNLIDNGPDAKKAITAIVHLVYPRVGEGGGNRSNKDHAERVAACEALIESLKTSITAVTGKAGLEFVEKTLQSQLDAEVAHLAKLNTPRKSKSDKPAGDTATPAPATLPKPVGTNAADLARAAAKSARKGAAA